MKYLPFLLCLLLLSFFITPLCHAEACSEGLIRAMKEEGLSDQQVQLICKKAELYQKRDHEEPEDRYSRALKFFDRGKYDDAISELDAYCEENPDEIKERILLAKAYLEKCESLKTAGDKAYKELISKPYYIGKDSLNKDAQNPELYYILAKSYLLNDRPLKASKHVKTAVLLSEKPPSQYYMLMGDSFLAQSKTANNSWRKAYFRKEAEASYDKALQTDNSDGLKARIQQKLDAVK